MIEGGPDHGTLKGFTSLPGRGLGIGTGHASDPSAANNHEIGAPYTGANACYDIAMILDAVSLYNNGPRVKYYTLGAYNSNGFTFTLLSDVNLSSSFGPLPTHFNPLHPTRPFFPGWSELVPGLVPFVP